MSQSCAKKRLFQNFSLLKFIYFHFKTPKKEILAFFKKTGETLIWQKSLVT